MRVEIYGIPLTAGKKQYTFITIEELPSDSALCTNHTSKYKILVPVLKKKSEVIIRDHCLA